MASLIPCPECARHIRVSEACPFCAPSTSKRSVLAAGLLVASMAACGTIVPASVYGGPPEPEPVIDAAVPDAAISDTAVPDAVVQSPLYGMPTVQPVYGLVPIPDPK